MPSLKDLRNRITSVKSTQKITKAMKMVAAAKLRKAQENAEKSRFYSEKMNEIIINLKNSITDMSSAPRLLTGNESNEKHLCVVMTADRGLCGGFNTNICKKSREFMNKLLMNGKELKIITVGSKSYDQLRRIYGKYIIEKISFKNQKKIKVSDANLISNKIISMFYDREFDICTIFYSKFKSVISQEPVEQQIIPVKNDDLIKNNQIDLVQYEYEPDEQEILNNLLPKNISTQILKGLLENAASEQGARMSAMDNASRNAGDLIEKLTINYNRSRQAVITKELIEIISGAETL
ncbi:MAG: F0F1 ATP synthase subunit gamma [Candidatus Pelagibacter sp.]|nr:F0F1 ATP synthase subunit gamma [Candidatus Pelagibacter sp.]OUV97373.1 MAG: F0F1 ATP synthase subunit gamma [Candidatus Pelagibacter sp. TMED142]|tara:strand:+ start:130 stop:1011 length:882 start_codon:yes stop_codon:yes gene_type:complete